MPEHCVLEAWCLRVCVVWLNGNLLGVKAYNFCLALGRPITLAERARTNSWSWQRLTWYAGASSRAKLH